MKQIRSLVGTKQHRAFGREQTMHPMYPYPTVLQPIKLQYFVMDIMRRQINTVPRFPLTGNPYVDGWLGATI